MPRVIAIDVLGWKNLIKIQIAKLQLIIRRCKLLCKLLLFTVVFLVKTIKENRYQIIRNKRQCKCYTGDFTVGKYSLSGKSNYKKFLLQNHYQKRRNLESMQQNKASN